MWPAGRRDGRSDRQRGGDTLRATGQLRISARSRVPRVTSLRGMASLRGTALLRGTSPLMLLVALALSGCGEKPQQPAAAAPPVTVATPVKRMVTDWDEFTG